MINVVNLNWNMESNEGEGHRAGDCDLQAILGPGRRETTRISEVRLIRGNYTHETQSSLSATMCFYTPISQPSDMYQL